MRFLFSLFAIMILAGFAGCNRDEMRSEGEDVTIERQEDYNREDMQESRTIPVESDDEIKVDRDVLGDDEVEIND